MLRKQNIISEINKIEKLEFDLVPNKEIYLSRTFKILDIFERHKVEFTNKNINVLSIGCGLSHEFLPIKIICDENNSHLNYVGVDIECFDDEGTIYNYFPEMKQIICDATDKHLLVNKINKENLLPKDGFDFIVLRHPHVTHYTEIFKKIMIETIPYLASKNCKVFVSCYCEREFTIIKDILKESHEHDLNQMHLIKCDSDCETVSNQIIGREFISMIFPCKGLAFQDQLNKQNVLAPSNSMFFKNTRNPRTDNHNLHLKKSNPMVEDSKICNFCNIM